jgi:hypothetical protein
MERESTEKNVVVRSKSQKGKKKFDASASKSRRASGSKKVRAKDIPASPDSSGSNRTDEDYAEFLKTYDPQESYPHVSSS